MRDVGQRVLRGDHRAAPREGRHPAGSILVAEDLTPSDTASLDPTKVVGFCTTAGGASSHVAILARALDIPAVAGIEPRALDIPEGTRVILDGAKGTLRMNVTEDEVDRIRRRQATPGDAAGRRTRARGRAGRHHGRAPRRGGRQHRRPRRRAGGHGPRAPRASGCCARSSSSSTARSAPTEDEQAEIYTRHRQGAAARPAAGHPHPGRRRRQAAALPADRAGGEPVPRQRGIRVGLDRPEILRTQVRAILRSVDAGAKINVMFPMIATIEDFRLAKAIFEEERGALGSRRAGRDHGRGAVRRGDGAQFAAEVDFFSVGTNDLTQYTLAMDRGHPKLAPQVDALNPAVLGLIGRPCAARTRPAGGSGSAVASRPTPRPSRSWSASASTNCSVSVPAIPSVKAQIRSLSLADARSWPPGRAGRGFGRGRPRARAASTTTDPDHPDPFTPRPHTRQRKDPHDDHLDKTPAAEPVPPAPNKLKET